MRVVLVGVRAIESLLSNHGVARVALCGMKPKRHTVVAQTDREDKRAGADFWMLCRNGKYGGGRVSEVHGAWFEGQYLCRVGGFA